MDEQQGDSPFDENQQDSRNEEEHEKIENYAIENKDYSPEREEKVEQITVKEQQIDDNEDGDGVGRLIKCSCFMSHYVEFVRSIRNQLSERHVALLKQTPFFHLLFIPSIIQSQVLIDELLADYDEQTNTFRIGPKCITWRPEDVALVLGLNLDGVHVRLKRPRRWNSTIEMKYFKNHKQRMRSSLEELLIDMVHTEGEEVEEDFVKILVLYIMGTFLFPISSISLASWLFTYIDDLNGLHKYAWARAVHAHVMHKLPDRARRVKQRREGLLLNVGYLQGCVPALFVWYYELTGVVAPTIYGEVPRIMKYEIPGAVHRETLRTKLSTLEACRVKDGLIPDQREIQFLQRTATVEEVVQQNTVVQTPMHPEPIRSVSRRGKRPRIKGDSNEKKDDEEKEAMREEIKRLKEELAMAKGEVPLVVGSMLS